jgi:hypothetical protein
MNVFSVPNLDDKNHHSTILDRVNHAVDAHSNPEEFFAPDNQIVT